MTIRFDGFPRKYHVAVEGKTSYDAGYSWGRQSRQNFHLYLGRSALTTNEIDFVSRSLACMQSLSSTGIFTYKGVNYLQQYMDTFEGFCVGAGIDRLLCAFVQMEYSVGCQTVFAKDNVGNVNFFHIEENVDDTDIPRMYWNTEFGYKPSSLQNANCEPKYVYRIVSWKSDAEDTLFFSYPGLVSGGAGMGINRKTDSVIVVDTLNTLRSPGLFWHNALASMIFSAGTIGALRWISSVLKRYVADSYGFCGGYAIHVLESPDTLVSLECGATFVHLKQPIKDATRSYIAQTNYPQSTTLRDVDKYGIKQSLVPDATAKSVQLGLSARGRTHHLRKLAKMLYPTTQNTTEELHRIDKTLEAFRGDWEQTPDSYVSNGIFSIYVAAYLTGTYIHGKGTCIFRAPVLQAKRRSLFLWWPLGKKLPWGKDLFAKAQKRLDMLHT